MGYVTVLGGSIKALPVVCTNQILQKLTSRDKEIQKLAAIGKLLQPINPLSWYTHYYVASEICDCQQEATSVQEELDQRKQEVCQLQANLQEAEKIIVSLDIAEPAFSLVSRSWLCTKGGRNWSPLSKLKRVGG